MRSILLKVVAAAVLLPLLSVAPAWGQTPPPQESAGKLLIERFGNFRAVRAAAEMKPAANPDFVKNFRITSAATRDYSSKDGGRFRVTVITSDSDSGAYALLTNARRATEKAGQKPIKGEAGIESFGTNEQFSFAKGPTFVSVQRDNASAGEIEPLAELAKAFSGTLDKGAGDVPVLVKHLPDWPNVQQRVVYAVNQDSLKQEFSNQPIMDVVSFEGGAEAAIADYHGPRMVIIEFNTPQIAGDNDRRIASRIQELRDRGQAVPTAYRRVGNYSVFVFDAANEQAGNQLIDQVKYQQIVQWLGQNPFRYDEATREFTQTTLGVFVAVVKASGLVIIGSLVFGGLLGALLFSWRRAQQRSVQAYSDAGGMLRLNLDEMTPRVDPARLLGPGN